MQLVGATKTFSNTEVIPQLAQTANEKSKTPIQRYSNRKNRKETIDRHGPELASNAGRVNHMHMNRFEGNECHKCPT